MSYAILIELPVPIKQELSRICLGLPSAEWNDADNLYILLKSLNKLTDTEKWDLIDKLGEIQIEPFSVHLEQISYYSKRGNGGSLLIHASKSPSLEKLKKQIESHLRHLNPHADSSNNQHFSVKLGTIQKELPKRMTQYFEANGAFTSSSFEINAFILAEIHQTEKRTFYQTQKRYILI